MTGEGGGRMASSRRRDFRLFVASRFLWGLALQMQALAIAWFVYDLTRDPMSLGLIGLFAFLPALSLALVTGAVADRFDRRRVLLLVHALMIVGLVAFLSLSSAGRVWPARRRLRPHGSTPPQSAPVCTRRRARAPASGARRRACVLDTPESAAGGDSPGMRARNPSPSVSGQRAAHDMRAAAQALFANLPFAASRVLPGATARRVRCKSAGAPKPAGPGALIGCIASLVPTGP